MNVYLQDKGREGGVENMMHRETQANTYAQILLAKKVAKKQDLNLILNIELTIVPLRILEGV